MHSSRLSKKKKENIAESFVFLCIHMEGINWLQYFDYNDKKKSYVNIKRKEIEESFCYMYSDSRLSVQYFDFIKNVCY